MNKILIDPHYCSNEEFHELKTYLEIESWSYEEIEFSEDSIDLVKSSFAVLISAIEDIIKKFPQKGNTSSECQKINLQQKLNEFSYTVNGIEQSDLKQTNDTTNVDYIFFHRIEWWLINENGERLEFNDIPESIENRIKEQIIDGCNQGELIDSIYLTERFKEEPINCSGWWKISNK